MSNKAGIQLAIQALKQDANLTQRRAAADFDVPQRTLSHRLAGKQAQRDWKPKLMKLLLTKEEAIVQHVLNLDLRGFPPQLATITDMADSLLA
jgi:predicted XRE-type DNA-binding protein